MSLLITVFLAIFSINEIWTAPKPEDVHIHLHSDNLGGGQQAGSDYEAEEDGADYGEAYEPSEYGYDYGHHGPDKYAPPSPPPKYTEPPKYAPPPPPPKYTEPPTTTPPPTPPPTHTPPKPQVYEPPPKYEANPGKY